MPKLIVEDAGKKRAFRLSKGRLTVGASESAKLSLASDGVADQHAELVVEPDGLIVRPFAEVTVDGVPVEGDELRVGLGQTVGVGGATLRLVADDDDGAAAKPAAKSAGRSASARGGARAAAARSGGGRPRRGAEESDAPPARGARASDRIRKQKGLPGWVVPVVAALVILVAWRIYVMMATDMTGALDTAENYNELGEYGSALTTLRSNIADPADLSPKQRERYDEIRGEAQAGVDKAEGLARNTKGFEYIHESIRRFHEKQIGDKDPADPAIKPRARMLRQRIAYFRAEWPLMPADHPDVLMVNDFDRELAQAVDLDDPLTLDDVLWNIYFWTGEDTGARKMFDEAFAVTQEYLATASGPDAERGRNELESLQRLRDAYHAERMQDAKAKFENNDPSVAAILEHSILHLGPGPHVEDAASRFVLLPNAAALLRGYKKQRPETFAALAQNPTIAAFIASQPDLQ